MTNLPELSGPFSGVAVLAISPRDEDHVSLRGIFSHSRWQLFEARSCQEALSLLEKNPIGVLVCESDCPDGDWKDLLEALFRFPVSPLLIVTSRHADDALWAEVLNLGAYDVLSKPFDRVEVTRIISLAWMHWKEEIARKARKAAKGESTGSVKRRSATA